MFDFDEIIERRGTNSIKYDFSKERGKPEGILPLWVADMDFRTPPVVTEAIKKVVEHGIYGYSEVKEDYFQSVANWFSERFDWQVEREWLVKTPGVVYAIAMAVRAFTDEGDSVLIQQPVYYPFSETVKANHRKLVNCPLVYQEGQYSIDFQAFEDAIRENEVKLFILCNPHNPVGRVWTKEELIQMGDICLKYNVIVVSDEIHMDFIYPGFKHHVFADLKPEYAMNSIVCTAPSKTFNLAGLQVSNILIPNRNLKHKFIAEIRASGYSQLNILGLVACQAAYQGGASWLEELKAYIHGNLTWVREFLATNLPEIKLIEPQGTYLIWLDCSALGLSHEELEDFITHKANLWLDGGTMFGEEGRGFQRINIACPRSTLMKAMRQMEVAVRDIKK